MPAGFDDADGDWQSVSSMSMFERLYLDSAQHGSITPALVKRNYAVLEKFWTEKLTAMRTGGAGAQIARKFGGPHGSAALVESYPQKLRAAADCLSTPNGIEAHYDELQAQRRANAAQAVEPLLDFILSNESLEPPETDRFFARSIEAGLELEEAAQLLYDTIVRREFEPVSEPDGETLASQLLSVQWVSRERRSAVQVSPVMEVIQSPVVVMPGAPPGPHLLLRTVLITSLGTILGLGFFFTLQHLQADLPVPAPDRSVVSTATAESAPSPPITMESRLPRPAEPDRDAITKAIDLIEKQRAAAEARQRQAEEEEAERKELDEKRRQEEEQALLQKALEDIEAALTTARGELAAGDYAAARDRLDEARETAVRDPSRFAGELAEIDKLRFDANTGLQRILVLQTRLVEIDALNDDGKFTAAITVATRLLKEADIPAEVAARAQRAITRAQEELRNGQKDVGLKDVRTRRTKGRSR
ncbi:MAG TPA: hypothetical protein VEK57_00305 [Thermoanaerobaculia bacterium]|nr:hypothetical protein [Thermoanaerobaculia bacterium]